MLAREVTRWTRVCDKRLHRLICYLYHECNLVLTCSLGDDLQDLKLALYSDASFADDLTTSKSCIGTVLSIVGPRTNIPLTWLCKKQTAVSHSSTESEIVALDTSIRVEGIPALGMFDCVLDVLLPVTGQSKKTLESSNVGKRKGMSIWKVHYVDPLGMLVPKRAKMVILEDYKFCSFWYQMP